LEMSWALSANPVIMVLKSTITKSTIALRERRHSR
jgi:hypothetical protein